MGLLTKITQTNFCVPLSSTSKNDAIEELFRFIQSNPALTSFDLAKSDVFEREDDRSTGLEKGIALPHASSSGVSAPIVAVGISNHGIDFGALDGKICKIIILVLTPPEEKNIHLETLMDVALYSKSKQFIDALPATTTPEEAYHIFKTCLDQ